MLYSKLSLSTQVYKWVPVTYYWGQPCDGLASHSGEVTIPSVASCYRNRVKLRFVFGSCATTFTRSTCRKPYLHPLLNSHLQTWFINDYMRLSKKLQNTVCIEWPIKGEGHSRNGVFFEIANKNTILS